MVLLPDLIETIKKAALQTTEASKPVAVMFGVVVSASPLRINVEQRLTIEAEQIVLSRGVTDYETTVTPLPAGAGWSTEAADSHTHAIKGDRKLKIHGALKVGEEVILLRMAGGQRFVVLDRIG